MTGWLIFYVLIMEIPIKKVTIEEEEVEIREWLTQEQEDEYNSLMVGEQEFEIGSSEDGVTKVMVNPNSLATARKYLVEALCVSLSWDEFNTKSPIFRDELFDKLNEVQNPKKKS